MDKLCCTNCFEDQDIKKFIKDKQVKDNCMYCKSKNVYVHDVGHVGQFIQEGIDRCYEDAANSVGYDSSEGGYQLPTSLIDEILIEEENIFSEFLDDPHDLINDLVVCDATPYVRQDPYGPPSGEPDEILYWENFCKVVRNQRRFTTFLNSGVRDYHESHEDPGKFLFHLAERFMPLLISGLAAGSKIYRARIEEAGNEFSHRDITSPPASLSGNNRMSPAGISYFYGALDPETCIHEIRPNIGEIAVVAEFELIQDMLILDLSAKIESRRSIFDPEYSFDYEEYMKPFLRRFVADFSRPIRKIDSEVEYTPTQVFTEFVKSSNFKDQWLYPDENGKEQDVLINGILFRSGVKKDGINVTLFRGSDISIGRREERQDAWLLFKGKKKYQITGVAVSSAIV